ISSKARLSGMRRVTRPRSGISNASKVQHTPASNCSFLIALCASMPWHLSMLWPTRSEEHTSELQSRENLVCRLLLEKNKTKTPARPDAPSSPPVISNKLRCLVLNLWVLAFDLLSLVLQP